MGHENPHERGSVRRILLLTLLAALGLALVGIGSYNLLTDPS